MSQIDPDLAWCKLCHHLPARHRVQYNVPCSVSLHECEYTPDNRLLNPCACPQFHPDSRRFKYRIEDYNAMKAAANWGSFLGKQT